MVHIDVHLIFISLLVLAISFLIDVTFGEPRNSIHPVVMIGRIISELEKPLRKMKNQILAGIFLLAIMELIVVTLVIVILYFFGLVFLAYIIVAGFLLKTSYALTSMGSHISPVIDSLSAGDIESARRHLSKVVRRETGDLDIHSICSASIETISEGFVDGFASPLFYFPYFGVPGSMFARVTSTLDSTVGYKDERNIKFGKASALADTFINYIPARLSGYIILLTSFAVSGRRKNVSLRSMSRRTESKNAGWPMGAIAIGLNVRLEKHGSYVLNEDGKLPEIEDVRKAMKVFYLASVIFTISFVIAPIILISAIL
ncbi:MAG: cobalamin biosynthesis protein [Thermoplasmata archaeon]